VGVKSEAIKPFEGDIIRVYSDYDEDFPEVNKYTDHLVIHGVGEDYPGFLLEPEISEECPHNEIQDLMINPEYAKLEIIGNIHDKKEEQNGSKSNS
jgi:hypothetical protein